MTQLQAGYTQEAQLLAANQSSKEKIQIVLTKRKLVDKEVRINHFHISPPVYSYLYGSNDQIPYIALITLNCLGFVVEVTVHFTSILEGVMEPRRYPVQDMLMRREASHITYHQLLKTI